jgi:dihydroorotate dehydrogenase (fumarate)
VKIGPFFSSLPHFARQVAEAGADGLTLFNRYPHPRIDLEQLEVVSNLDLSTPSESRLVIRWIAILRDQLSISLSATSGFHSPQEVLQALLAGADSVQVLSVLLHRGPQYLGELLAQMKQWLEEHEYESIEQLKGSMSRLKSPDPSAYERANYLRALARYTCQLP